MEAKNIKSGAKYSAKSAPRNNVTIIDNTDNTSNGTKYRNNANNANNANNTKSAPQKRDHNPQKEKPEKPEKPKLEIPISDAKQVDPYNLRNLLEDMAAYTGGDILGQLKHLCGEHIFVRHDKFGTDSSDYGRVMLTTNRHAASYDRELDSQCNGIILSYPQCKLLSLCQRNFNPRPKLRVIAEFIKEYNIYPINDGTTITLYYYNDAWRVSSTNGIDIGEFKWVGEHTYMEAIVAAMKKHNVCLEDLKPNYSYTIGFRCSDYHPLIDPSAPTCWIIQICDLEKYELVQNNLAIPTQRPIMVPGAGERKLEFAKKTNEASLNAYKEMRTRAHNGYIFRHKTGAKCDFILESLLFKSIKKLIYNLPGRNADLPAIPATQRLQYCALRAYLHKVNHKLFIDLFPQFQNNYDNFDIIFNALVNRIVANLRGTTQAGGAQLDTLVAIIAGSIKESGFDSMSPDCESVITDFVINVNYIEMYFKYIMK